MLGWISTHCISSASNAQFYDVEEYYSTGAAWDEPVLQQYATCASTCLQTCACRLKEVPGNWYRLNRVLDILLSTGRPLGELDLNVEAPLDYDFRCFFLNRSRIELYRRIDARVEDMVYAGLLQVPSSSIQILD